MREKVARWGGAVFAAKQSVHMNVGEAQVRTRAAGLLFDALVADTWNIAEQRAFNLDARLELKLRAAYIAELTRETVTAMMARAGTSSYRKDAPLQRFFRDLNALASHAFIDWDQARELYGRHRFGLEPNYPLI